MDAQWYRKYEFILANQVGTRIHIAGWYPQRGSKSEAGMFLEFVDGDRRRAEGVSYDRHLKRGVILVKGRDLEGRSER